MEARRDARVDCAAIGLVVEHLSLVDEEEELVPVPAKLAAVGKALHDQLALRRCLAREQLRHPPGGGSRI